uniref:FDF domain-containing protein n=2 Tax=Meloidogyne incognita TaxID=6306 RepID=A0A914KYY8_MELIC
MALVPEEVPTTSADEATKEFFGYLVEVDCGEEGSYSGLVTQVEPADNNLGTWGKMKLETPFRNGVPLGEQVAIFVPGELIVNIKVLNMPSSQQPQPFVFTPTKQPQSAPQTPRPAISLQQTQQPQRTSNQLQQPVKFQHQLPHRVLQPYPKFQHQLPERALQQQQQKFPHQQQPKFLHQTRFLPLQSPKFSPQHPRFSLQQQQSPKLSLQRQLPQHSIQQQQQRLPLNPFSYPFVDKNQVIRPNTATPQGFHRIFKNRKQGLQITEPPPQNNNNNKTTKFVPRSVEINNKKEKSADSKTVVKQNSNKRAEKSVPKAEQKKRTESTTSSNQQIQKTVENIVKDEKIREQVDRNAALFAKLKVDDQSTIESRQQQFESLKKIEEQQKQKAQNRKKIGDKLKKQIEDHIKKTEKEAAEKKEIKKEEENQKDSKKDEENKKNVEEKKFGGKQQNSFEIQSSSKTPNDGDLASIRCPDGIYQGVVKEVNAEDQTIRLENPLLNGVRLSTNFIDLPHTIMKGVKFYPDDRNGNNRRRSSRELRGPKIFEGVYMQSLPVSSVQRKQQHQSERRSDSPKVNNKKDSEVETRSPTQLAHEEYGEYKRFTEPQIPFPVKLQLNTTPKRHLNSSNSGPTGIPTIDCINGYRGYGDKNNFVDTMGDPLDYETLNTDFDFAANLALFDKAAFTKQIDHVALGLNSSGSNSRNYNHDENVLLDSSRVISWTTNNLAPSSSAAVKNSAGINVAHHSPKSCPHRRQ